VTNPAGIALLQDGLDMHRRSAVADAAARYSQILKFEPKNVDALCLLGVACSKLERFAEAVDLLRKAVKLTPKHAPAHNLLGAALKGIGRNEEALASFNRAISHQPDYSVGERAVIGRRRRSSHWHREANMPGRMDRDRRP
jgi:Flp pilus assembly protein TadD